MKKLLLMTLLSCVFLQARADTWTDGEGVIWTYTLSGSNASITNSSKKTGDLFIPRQVNGFLVTEIDFCAFRDCRGLTSVTIPSSVTDIDDYAFSGCSGLTSVTIPEGVTRIGYSAFSACTGLTSVTINSNAIMSKSYSSSSNIGGIFGSKVKEYIIGEGVTSIGDDAFRNCSGLTSVTIPSSVTTVL